MILNNLTDFIRHYWIGLGITAVIIAAFILFFILLKKKVKDLDGAVGMITVDKRLKIEKNQSKNNG